MRTINDVREALAHWAIPPALGESRTRLPFSPTCQKCGKVLGKDDRVNFKTWTAAVSYTVSGDMTHRTQVMLCDDCLPPSISYYRAFDQYCRECGRRMRIFRSISTYSEPRRKYCCTRCGREAAKRRKDAAL